MIISKLTELSQKFDELLDRVMDCGCDLCHKPRRSDRLCIHLEGAAKVMVLTTFDTHPSRLQRERKKAQTKRGCNTVVDTERNMALVICADLI